MDKEYMDQLASNPNFIPGIYNYCERWCEHFPQRQDDILNILVHLEQRRRKSQTAFPNARAFIRPGLD
jgi:hypothetical protein